MTTNVIYEEFGSDWSLQVSAVVTTRWFKIYCFASAPHSIWMWVDDHCSLLVNPVLAQQIHSAMATKSGRVIAWKVIIEAADLKGSGR